MKEAIRIGQTQLEFLATGEETAGNLTMFEMTVEQGASVPVAHHHEEVEEVVYGLDGVLTYTVDGREHELRRGDHLLVPRGAVHGFSNLHEGDARVLCVLTPASIGPAFFREVAEVVNAGGPPDPKTVGEIMLRHGLVPVP
jgi:quercetin dioxygenase-like cupin family protein